MMRKSKGVCGVCILVAMVLGSPGPIVWAHEDPVFLHDRQPPYRGPSWRAVNGGQPALGFPHNGVQLDSWITLFELNSFATSASDCWGYVSPSGREYALIGVSTGTGFVEITDPVNAQVIAFMPGPNSLWRDTKVFQQFAYSVSEGGGGIQVFDLTQIDQGIVTLASTVTTGPGTTASHNVAINEESGFLYRVGGAGFPLEGIRIYSLANPANPVFVGQWNGRYCHDAQVVSWTAAPFAGREIAFCYAGDTSGGGNPGVDILDVTNKANITLIGSVNLAAPPIFSHKAQFSHQGWLSPDRRFIYFGDELDEGSFPFAPTTTRIIDVSDLTNPTQVGIFTNGNTSKDHNLYTLGNMIFEANYRSGLRVYDATDPMAPVEVAFFDTFPPDDNASFNGLWNVFPYFPSGTVIGSDLEKGLFVWTLVDPVTVTAPLPATGYPHAVAKNRYISFVPDPANAGTPHGYQVTHGATGQSWFISTPRTTPASINGQGLTYLVSDMAPPQFDFGTQSIIHVGGCMIAPGETYEIRATTDGFNLSAPLTVTTASLPTNGRSWGDVVGVFSAVGDPSTTPATPPNSWTPPNGQVTGFDVTAMISAFQGTAAPHVTWVDLDPVVQDRVTNGNDILREVNAFAVGTGMEFYPFSVPNPPGPQGQGACPGPTLESALAP